MLDNPWNPSPQDVYFKGMDNSDPRVSDLVHEKVMDQITHSILGYPDDEGIRINGGRVGASLAPNMIRRFLYKMTPHLFSRGQPQISDLGNLSVQMNLSERHDIVRRKVHQLLMNGHRVIGLGGGHDYGFGDGAGFLDWATLSSISSGQKSSPNQEHVKSLAGKPLVINFDAHLDVRPTDHGLTSGTPFSRLLNEFDNFDLALIGIQSHCNSRSHWEWAKKRGALVVPMDEAPRLGEAFDTVVLERLKPWLTPQRPTYVSVDLDGFSSSVAPGCSQSWATGFGSKAFFRIFSHLLKHLDVRVLGLYEVSPPLDCDDRTSKLAAQIAHTFIFSLNEP